jgi:hypothetical protein
MRMRGDGKGSVSEVLVWEMRWASKREGICAQEEENAP